MPIFTSDEREHLRDQLISAAENDPNICGAAHTGSAASSRLDRWSDIDLALCLNPDANAAQIITNWTDRLYRQHDAVAHVDVMRGATLFRVFLLRNTLQVDIAFWSAQEFGAIGPNFRLIFMRDGNQAKPPIAAPQPNASSLIGMAWLYSLHVRSSLARGRTLQTEYMLGGMRNHVCELICLRCGTTAQQGRGLDDLPISDRDVAAACLPRSLESYELKRAFQKTTQALLKEIRHIDPALADRLDEVLRQLAA